MKEALLTAADVHRLVQDELTEGQLASTRETVRVGARTIELCDALPIAIEVLEGLIGVIKNPLLKLGAKVAVELLKGYHQEKCG